MKPSAKDIFTHPIHFLAFGFGSGLSPVAPGTMGTLAAIPIYYFIQDLAWYFYLAIVLATFVAGVWICDVTTKYLDVHDHPGIVWDEIVGFLLTMFLVPSGWFWIVLGFGLFRLFDIWKPWPINLVDKQMHSGMGIMLDDVVAAVYAWALLQIIVLGNAYF